MSSVAWQSRYETLISLAAGDRGGHYVARVGRGLEIKDYGKAALDHASHAAQPYNYHVQTTAHRTVIHALYSLFNTHETLSASYTIGYKH